MSDYGYVVGRFIVPPGAGEAPIPANGTVSFEPYGEKLLTDPSVTLVTAAYSSAEIKNGQLQTPSGAFVTLVKGSYHVRVRFTNGAPGKEFDIVLNDSHTAANPLDLNKFAPVPASPDIITVGSIAERERAEAAAEQSEYWAGQAASAVAQTNDTVMTGILNDSTTNFAKGIDAIIPVKRFPVAVNTGVLSGFRDKLLMARQAPVSITVAGDSISWGVGTDGLASSSTGAIGPQQNKYRENAWPMQLGEKLNAIYGTRSSIGFLGPWYSDRTSTWAAATGGSGTVQFSASLGPFGNQASTNKGGGIMSFGSVITWDKTTLTRPFTELDVYIHADTTTPATPSVWIDGVQKYTGVAATGGFQKITVTGLTDDLHAVELRHNLASTNVYGAFIVPRRANGVTVNRIASSGATSTDAVNSARAVKVAVMAGNTDLAIIAFSANDQITQVPIATFKANLQQMIDAATSPVLLIDAPPVAAPAGTLKPVDYKNAMLDLVTANPTKVAFASINAAMGTYAEALSRGMFATSGTIHPSWVGADLISDFLEYILVRSY